MGYIVRMPQMGMSMEEGTVVEWRVAEGDRIEEGATVAVVESEKTTADVEAREGTTLRAILAAAGETVEPGDPIGVVAAAEADLDPYLAEAGVGGADVAAAAEADVEAEPESSPAPGTGADAAESGDADGGDADADGDDAVERRVREMREATTRVMQRTSADDGAAAGAGSDADTAREVRASPGARRLAADRDVDVAAVEGTGPEGVVVEADVRRAAEAAEVDGTTAGTVSEGAVVERETGATVGGVGADEVADGESPDEGTTVDRERGPATRTVAAERELSRIQRTTADRLSRSAREAPHVTLDRRVDVEAVETVLGAAETLGVEASFTDLVVAAAADALVAHPEVNACYEDGTYELIEEVNVAVAVDADGDLLTPVIADADELSVPELGRVRRAMTDRILAGERSMDDLTGATFTISNLGPFGVDRFSPIVDPPQVAILGVGRIRDGGVTLSLSFDHRVLNGAGAARFLGTLAGTLTDADALAARFGPDD
jgi:pyruvate dehydrogenase E2 component (dihydrolipoamide acetyltransferase)